MTPRRLLKRGSVAIMTALLAIPLVAMVGASIDLARVWLVKSRLQMSLDAAVLVVGKSLPTGVSTTDGFNLFWANWSAPNASTAGYLGATATTPIPSYPTPTSVKLTSTATVQQTFLGLIGIGTITVNAASTAQTSAFGLELALVLDVTGSMAGNNAIGALRTAANNLLDILYGGADTQPHLWVSVVPFAATINIGSQHTSWLKSGTLNQSEYSPRSWMGCVMARTTNLNAPEGGDDFNDKTPAQAPFEQFFYASTYQKYGMCTTGSGSHKVTNYCTGDNDWTATNIKEPAAGDGDYGPNLDCPTPAQAILPETASHATVKAVIGSLSPTYRGGTFINLGLQAGWFTLSPNWQPVWNTSDTLFTPAKPLPLDYNTPYMKKVIVLMTDGQNNWNDWTGGAPGQGPPGWTDDGDADYTAYGRLLTNTRGLSVTDPTTTLNNWMLTMCATIKNPPNNIIIYTILFNSGIAPTQATINLFSGCASPGNYHYSPTQADLKSYFSQIGEQLSSLRLAQ